MVKYYVCDIELLKSSGNLPVYISDIFCSTDKESGHENLLYNQTCPYSGKVWAVCQPVECLLNYFNGSLGNPKEWR